MTYYNVHTHRFQPTEMEQNREIVSILNSEPDKFHDLKKKASNPNIKFSCGIHPWNRTVTDEMIDLLREIVENEEVTAIGECGLDKRQGCDMDVQIYLFSKQIELAIDCKKPMIIHCVKAWGDLIGLHKKYKPQKPWIIHGFRGNNQQALQLNRMGFWLSFGEHFNAESLKNADAEKILLETDISNLSIYEIYDKVASSLNENIYKLIDILSGNFKKSFFEV